MTAQKTKLAKGNNCSGNCRHYKYKEIFNRREERDSNGQIIMRCNDFVGYEWYCDINPEKCKQFQEENGNKKSTWVLENVDMDCYEPTDSQKLMDDILSGLDELLTKITEQKNG